MTERNDGTTERSPLEPSNGCFGMGILDMEGLEI